MDAHEKLQLVGPAMLFETDNDLTTAAAPRSSWENRDNERKQLACSPGRSANSRAKQEALGITQAVMPGGKRINLLKTMMTTACERNCNYCSFRAGRNYRRATFKPDEMAGAFMKMHRAGMVEGLFLSSGIIRGGISSQDKIIDTADILRNRMGYRGYIHLKIMPGADDAQVLRTMQLANRVSVNLEAPNDRRLSALAPKKIFMQELLDPLRRIDEIRRNEPASTTWNGRWASSCTQFVVGAAGESDLELLATTSYLLKNHALRRTYFMAFNPVPDTPLENLPAENPWRQHRLYQASYLLRDYNFDLEELPFTNDGQLPLSTDPKVAWAKSHLLHEPVELNRADPSELQRVPGIGPKGVKAILAARRRTRLSDLTDLQKIGVNPSRPAPYVLLNGRRPNFQLPLF